MVGNMLVRRVHLQNQRHHRRVQINGQIGRRVGLAVLQQGKGEISFALRQVHLFIEAFLLCLFHGANQFVELQGLIEIIDRVELDRVFQVFLIGIAAEKQYLQRGSEGSTSLMSAMPSSFACARRR